MAGKEDKTEVFGPQEAPIDVKAEIKRNENSKFDNYENKNPFTRENMKELTGGEKATWKKVDDAITDLSIPLLSAFAASKMLSLPEKYKAAKLREAADYSTHSYVTPLAPNGGLVTSPEGPLSHAIHNIWGKAFQGKGKILEKKLYEIRDNIINKKIKTGELTREEAREMGELLNKGNVTPEASKIIDEIVEEYNSWVIKNVPNAGDKVKRYVKYNQVTDAKGHPKITVEIPKIDKFTRNLPAIAGTAATFVEGNALLKDAQKFFFKPDKGGVTPSGLPTISEILNASNLSYDKEEAIKECNKAFDYIMENGNEGKLMRAYEAYGNTNFNKKKDVINTLKVLVSLVEDEKKEQELVSDYLNATSGNKSFDDMDSAFSELINSNKRSKRR